MTTRPYARTVATAHRLVHPPPTKDNGGFLISDNEAERIERAVTRSVSTLVPKIRRNPSGWGVDQLPYSNRLESTVKRHFLAGSELERRTAALATYVVLQNMRKRGVLFTKAQPPDRPRPKQKPTKRPAPKRAKVLRRKAPYNNTL